VRPNDGKVFVKMTDIGKAVERIGQTLKAEFGKKPPKRPLRRHRDDNYWDEIVILSGQVVLHGFIVPRYKTSGLSGDEWRISARLVVKYTGNPVIERSFHRMNDLLKYAPGFIYSERERLLQGAEATTLVAKRKRIDLCELTFNSFGDAAMGMAWHLVTANEGTAGVKWHHLTDEEERARCQQVGCAEPPVNVYHLKKLLYGDHPPDTFFAPKYDFEGQYVWYCARHTTRGDCGFEDADNNLELVEGDGTSVQRGSDESPSILGGVTEVEMPED
jgi:hypothetical protein